MAVILIITTDKEFEHRASSVSARQGHLWASHASLEAAGRSLKDTADLVVVDFDSAANPDLTVHKLTALHGRPGILAVTSDENTPDQARRAGAWEVLLPPFSPARMEEAMTQCLTLRQARIAAAGAAAGAPAGSASLTIPIILDAAHEDALLPLRTVRDLAMHEVEAAYLRHLIAQAQGSFQRVQTAAGISRARLYDLLNKHALRIDME